MSVVVALNLLVLLASLFVVWVVMQLGFVCVVCVPFAVVCVGYGLWPN